MDPTRGRLPTPEAHDPTSTRTVTDTKGGSRQQSESPTHTVHVDRSAGPAPPHGRHERLRNGGAWSDPWSGRVKIGTRPRQRSSRARHGRALRGPVAAPGWGHTLSGGAHGALRSSAPPTTHSKTGPSPSRIDVAVHVSSLRLRSIGLSRLSYVRTAPPGQASAPERRRRDR